MRSRFTIWRYFLDGMPAYLARHYWWAYLWQPAIRFFDHQPIINAILFGQYQRLLDQTLACLKRCPGGRLLQLTCVYGKLTPVLMQSMDGEPLYLVDVAPQQLQHSRAKSGGESRYQLLPARMNAEYLALAEHSFATVLIFFLFHEMPPEARQRTLDETLRIIQQDGRLVITEYGPLPRTHWLYRFWPSRWLITRLEPFLDGFWREDLAAILQERAQQQGKGVKQIEEYRFFNDFYRVVVFEVTGL
ncbi:MAG TPA: class I SAM-dependent methyltransferase [Gammaproteobacteria bacterium]|nr:class I SAM-dependent methyltransferase [Gammaproteobacteria bacterium]